MIRKTILKTNWSGRFVCESLSDRLYWKVIVVCVNRFAGPTVCCGCTQPFGANGTWGAMGATRLLPWRQTSNVVRNVSTARLVCLFDFFFLFSTRDLSIGRANNHHRLRSRRTYPHFASVRSVRLKKFVTCSLVSPKSALWHFTFVSYYFITGLKFMQQVLLLDFLFRIFFLYTCSRVDGMWEPEKNVYNYSDFKSNWKKKPFYTYSSLGTTW